MRLELLAVFTFLFPFRTHSLNLKNNACPTLFSYHYSDLSPKCYYNPDVLSDFSDMVERHDYVWESHGLTTKDGYILHVYRVHNKVIKATKGPVFLMNGIATNAGTWFDIGNRSLAFVLADRGYEVWVGNWRGTKGSTGHVSLTIKDPKYWDFCIDTLVAEDLRSQLRLVSQKTEMQQKIVYIGHSMGTTTSFMFASEFSQEAEELLGGLITLAPVAYLDGVAAIELVKPFVVPLLKIFDLFKKHVIFYHIDAIYKTVNVLCRFVPFACRKVIDLGFGPSTKFKPEDLLVFYSYWPERISIFLLLQYLQIAQAKTFQKYNYGLEMNEKMYGAKKPPHYDLGKIQIPVRFFYGQADILYKKKNLKRLYDEISSENKRKYNAPTNNDGKYNHNDFIYANDLLENLYPTLIEVLDTGFKESGNNLQ